MTKKLLITALILSAFTLVTGPALAVDTSAPAVSIVQLPTYLNVDSFEISYTALDSGGSGLASVLLQFHKEGQGWQNLGTFTENSKKFDITPLQINEETKYYFKVTATDGAGNSNSSETITTIDRSAPPTPESYSKERLNSQTYRLRWHNTDSDDIYQVYVYRFDTAGFTANSSTLVAQVSVSKNTDNVWDNAVPVADREYFYILRGVDRAGNASSPLGDVVVVTETSAGMTTGTNGQPVIGNEAVEGQTLVLSGDVNGSVLGEDTNAPTEEKMAEAVAEESFEVGNPVEQIQSAVSEVARSSLFWPLAGLAGLGFVVYWFLLRKR